MSRAGAEGARRLREFMPSPPHMQQKRPDVPASPMFAPAALAESSSEELRAPPPPPPPQAQAAVVGRPPHPRRRARSPTAAWWTPSASRSTCPAASAHRVEFARRTASEQKGCSSRMAQSSSRCRCRPPPGRRSGTRRPGRPAQRPHHARQPEPRVGAVIGEEHGGAVSCGRGSWPGASMALLAYVVVGRDGQHGHHQHVQAPGRDLEQVPGDSHEDEPGEVHVAHVLAEVVAVDDHAGEGRRRGEEAAVDNEDVDVLRGDLGLGEQVVDGGEDDELDLGAGGLEAPALEQARHEPDAALVEARPHAGVLLDAANGTRQLGLVRRSPGAESTHGRRELAVDMMSRGTSGALNVFDEMRCQTWPGGETNQTRPWRRKQ
ncbi:atherin-like isoform X3 [Triticum dicoccoides]|nr:atherin-like isoform X3 [Triticum dicoccoides]